MLKTRPLLGGLAILLALMGLAAPATATATYYVLLKQKDGTSRLPAYCQLGTTFAVANGTLDASVVNLSSISAGASGTAGTLYVYPATANKGRLAIQCGNQTDNTTKTLTIADMGQTTTVTIPDPGAASASVVLTAGNQTIGGTKTFSAALKTSSGVGTAATGKATAVELGGGVIHQTVLTLTLSSANAIVVADGAKTTGVKVYDFPEGRILVLGATINAQDVTDNHYNADTNDIYYLGVGTADGTQAADADLTSTEQDIIPKTTINTDNGTGAGTALTNAWKSAMSTLAAANNVLDGTTTAVDLYVNVAVPAASNTDATQHEITGTLTVTWINLGDY